MNILRNTMAQVFYAALLLLVLTRVAHAGIGGDELGPVLILVIAPLLVLFAIAAFAALCIFAIGVHKGPLLVEIGERALENSQRGRLLHCVWGCLCAIFIATAAAIFIHIEIFALLGVLLLIAGVMLTGFGILISSANLGARVIALWGGESRDPIGAIRIGLPLLLLASAVPIVGSLQIIIAATMGMGAVLEAIVRRE